MTVYDTSLTVFDNNRSAGKKHFFSYEESNFAVNMKIKETLYYYTGKAERDTF